MWWLTFLFFLAALGAAPFIFYYYHVLFKYRSIRKKIPGPKPLPLVGYRFEKTGEGVFRQISEFCNKYNDRFVLFNGPEPRVFHMKAEHMQFILTSNHITKSDNYVFLKGWISEGLITSTGKKWSKRRKMITPSFHFKILEEFMKIFNTGGDDLIESLEEEVGKPSVNIFENINLFSLDIFLQTAMGVDGNSQDGGSKGYIYSMREILARGSRKFFSYWERLDAFFWLVCQDYDIYKKNLKSVHKFTDGIIKTKRKELKNEKNENKINDDDEESSLGIKKKTALLDMLLKSENSREMSDEDIREEVDTFTFAGHDTSTTGSSFLLYELSKNTEIQQKLFDEINLTVPKGTEVTLKHLNEMKYLDLVVKESLRKYPSVPFIERKIEEEFELDGVVYPSGTVFSVPIFWLHHNPEYWNDPEKFIPERFLPENQAKQKNFSYIPFSAGARNCIGAKYAQSIMKTTVIKFLQNFELLPVPGHKLEFAWNAVLKSVTGTCVRLRKRDENSA